MPETPTLVSAAPAGDWSSIGQVVGNASTSEFSFVLKSFRSRVGDLVAVKMDVPSSDYRGKNPTIYVWGRVTNITRYNPFFPYEAAQELAEEGLNLRDTILSDSRDQLEATVLILGCTPPDNAKTVFPLTYPVQPAATVFYPPAAWAKELLAGSLTGTPLQVGTLIARSDVDVNLSADRLVSRHLAILAMTGGGKTVAARRILRELIVAGYPILIFDPHGDYLGFSQKQALFADRKIKLFFPYLTMSAGSRSIVEKLIAKMTQGISDPQREYIAELMAGIEPRAGTPVRQYIGSLLAELGSRISAPRDKRQLPTMYAVRRALNQVDQYLSRMELTNDRMRATFARKGLTGFDQLPDPNGSPEQIIAPKQVSILYLGGYDQLTQCTIVSILMESLFEHRAAMTDAIPPFATFIEEAHTFIPSNREGAEDAPSVDTLRKVITEGRKFGTGLVLITQRPSRVDETILSQCNSFLVLRLVNPKDHSFVRSVMENMSDADARLLPGFGPGQGIVSGQAVRFPLLVQIRKDDDLMFTELGDENFIEQAQKWKPPAAAAGRASSREATKKLAAIPTRKAKK
ncbi:ATP-binding protein [Gemmata sp. JC673]|uniref:ATP-binding protein n=1 Tax=Gemmata algarum TaxID=2975278 RepID=A0ABU5F7I0_9BACT|nr:ATP-binding protein [Gemmata algarum]MDY3562680.1 ATP-binding protein [Gemmata algarum]